MIFGFKILFLPLGQCHNVKQQFNWGTNQKLVHCNCKKTNTMIDANIKIIGELKEFLNVIGSKPELKELFTGKPSDFSRNRKLTIDITIFLILNMLKRSLVIEVLLTNLYNWQTHKTYSREIVKKAPDKTFTN